MTVQESEDLFFDPSIDDKEDKLAELRELCSGCFVRSHCAQNSMDPLTTPLKELTEDDFASHGLWAGFTAEERHTCRFALRHTIYHAWKHPAKSAAVRKMLATGHTPAYTALVLGHPYKMVLKIFDAVYR